MLRAVGEHDLHVPVEFHAALGDGDSGHPVRVCVDRDLGFVIQLLVAQAVGEDADVAVHEVPDGGVVSIPEFSPALVVGLGGG